MATLKADIPTPAADTNTTYSIATPGGETGNQVKKYQLVETPHTDGVAETAKNLEPVIIDTDTKYELAGGKEGETAADGTTTYKISLTSPNGGEETSATVYDTNTKYETKTVLNGATEATTWKSGDATFSMIEKGTDNGKDKTVGSLTIKAGDNVAITKDSQGAAVINARDTTLVATDGSDGSKYKALDLQGDTLTLLVKDTAGNEVKSSVDLKKYAGTDTNTKYTAKADVSGAESATSWGNGDASFSVTELADPAVEGSKDTVLATLKLKAGENVAITGTDEYGVAVINAQDTNTTYSVKTTEGSAESGIINTYTLQSQEKGSTTKADVAEIVDTDTQYKLSGDGGKANGYGGKDYTIDLKTLAGAEAGSVTVVDTNTTYKLEQTTKDGSTTFTVREAIGNKDKVGSATLTAGQNVQIEDDGNGGAKILAKDTTYTHEVTKEGLKAGQISKLTITNDLDEKDTVTFYDTDTRNTVVKGNNITVEETPQADGSIQYTINGKDTVIKEGANVKVAKNENKDTGVTTYTISATGGGIANINFNGDTGNTIETPETLNIQGGIKEASELTDDENPNIGVVSDGKGTLKVKLAKDLKGLETVEVKNSVTVGGNTTINQEGMTISGAGDKGDQTIKITKTEVNMGGNVIHNVAPGKLDDDAVNVSQLRQSQENADRKIRNLNRKIGSVAEDVNAGVAMALAASSLPQAYLPGKSMMAVAGGAYRGEQGYAIGFSSVSESGNWVIKANAASNTQGHHGAAVGAGYMW